MNWLSCRVLANCHASAAALASKFRSGSVSACLSSSSSVFSDFSPVRILACSRLFCQRVWVSCLRCSFSDSFFRPAARARFSADSLAQAARTCYTPARIFSSSPLARPDSSDFRARLMVFADLSECAAVHDCMNAEASNSTKLSDRAGPPQGGIADFNLNSQPGACRNRRRYEPWSIS